MLVRLAKDFSVAIDMVSSYIWLTGPNWIEVDVNDTYAIDKKRYLGKWG